MSVSEMGVVRCSSTSPVSMPPSGQNTVRPVSVSPLMTGQLIALRPRCRGRSEGWYWIVPCVGHGQEPRRDDQRDEGHHLEVGRETRGTAPATAGSRNDAGRTQRQPGGQRGLRQRVLPRALRRGVHRHHVVAPLEQRLEHGLAEGLLAVHHDPHASLLASPSLPRRLRPAAGSMLPHRPCAVARRRSERVPCAHGQGRAHPHRALRQAHRPLAALPPQAGRARPPEPRPRRPRLALPLLLATTRRAPPPSSTSAARSA